MISQTSIQSFKEIQPELGERQIAVYKILKHCGSCNNTMLSNYLCLPISSITPRVNELRKYKMVELAGVGKCPYTNRQTKFWRVKKQ